MARKAMSMEHKEAISKAMAKFDTSRSRQLYFEMGWGNDIYRKDLIRESGLYPYLLSYYSPRQILNQLRKVVPDLTVNSF